MKIEIELTEIENNCLKEFLYRSKNFSAYSYIKAENIQSMLAELIDKKVKEITNQIYEDSTPEFQEDLGFEVV